MIDGLYAPGFQGPVPEYPGGKPDWLQFQENMQVYRETTHTALQSAWEFVETLGPAEGLREELDERFDALRDQFDEWGDEAEVACDEKGWAPEVGSATNLAFGEASEILVWPAQALDTAGIALAAMMKHAAKNGLVIEAIWAGHVLPWLVEELFEPEPEESYLVPE
jgi:hypothetical protein